jgi:5-methylcytosine-specific restriction endonuclease McrA
MQELPSFLTRYHSIRIGLRLNDARLRKYNLSISQISSLFEVQEGYCFYCGVCLPPYTVEHKTPLSRGGTLDLSNVALSCRSCNIKKKTKTAEEYFEYLTQRM